jgi:hypothetical protein
LELAILLLERGADVEDISTTGWTPLHRAAYNGHAEVCGLLLDHGADVAAKDQDDETPLHHAANDGCTDVVNLLLERGADVNSKTTAGETPLHWASKQGNVGVARLLVEHGVDTRATDNNGKTAVNVASGNAMRKVLFKNAAHAAAPAVAVPADVEALLARLSLSSYGTALVSVMGVATCDDLVGLREEHLKEGLPSMKVGERLRLLNAISPAPAAAPAAVPVPVVTAAERLRVRALVVGINAYNTPVPGRLANAVADATAVHETLSKLPGAASTLLTDCTKAEFEAALVDFRDGTGVCKGRGMSVTAEAAQPASEERTLGLVFFAGHGLQVSNRNYLVPADFTQPHKNTKLEPMLKDTARACVSLEAIEDMLEDADVTAGAILLDCCRNLPDFLAELGAKRSTGGTRALPAGMSEAAPRLRDLMVTFATAPGSEALDSSSRMPNHSPFTAALLKAFEAPKRLLELNPFLTDEVHQDSNGKQRPFIGGSFGSEAGNLLLG